MMHGGIRTQGVIRHVHQHCAVSWGHGLGPVNSNPGLDRDVLVFSVESSALVLLVLLKRKRKYLPLTNIKRSVVWMKTIYYHIYLISSTTKDALSVVNDNVSDTHFSCLDEN